MLAGVRAQIGQRKMPFGHELEQLSSVYVNLDDFNETERFRANPDTISDLEELARALEAEAAEFLTAELTKKLAVLHDHIQFLQKYETNEALKNRLNAIDEHLRQLLAEFLGQPNAGDASGGESTSSYGAHIAMSDEDSRDLRFLLEADMSMSRSWAMLLRWLWQSAKILGRKVRRR